MSTLPILCTMHHILLSILFQYTSTASIHIQNAGFELDTMPNGDPIPEKTYQYGAPIITQWTPYDPNSITGTECFGVSNPINGDNYVDGPREGNQIGWVWTNKVGKGEIGITQQLSDIVAADTSYTLTVYIGDPASITWSSQSTDGATTDKNDGFPGYRVDLLAGNNILATDNNTLSINEGHWMESTVTANVFPTNPYIGQTLSIRLVNLAQAQGKEVDFDFVRLNSKPITSNPTLSPTNNPTPAPTSQPTPSPTNDPTPAPTSNPTPSPTGQPSPAPTDQPTLAPTNNPTPAPTSDPTNTPTVNTKSPTNDATTDSTNDPTNDPTSDPTLNPTKPTTSRTNNDGSGNIDERVTTKSVSDGSTNNGATKTEQGLLSIDDTLDIIILIAAILVILLLLCIIGVCVFRKCRKQNNRKILVEMNTPTSNDETHNASIAIPGPPPLANTQQTAFVMNVNTEEGNGEMEVNDELMVINGPTPNGAPTGKVMAVNDGILNDRTVEDDGNMIYINVGSVEENGNKNDDEIMNDLMIGNMPQMIEDVFNEENDDEKMDELYDDEDVLFGGIKTPQ